MKWTTGLLMLGALMLASRARGALMFDSPPPNGDRAAFIEWIAPKARAMQRRLGIPASATIAQAIYESGDGASWLARNARNLFGMTGVGTGAGNPFWNGDKIFRADRYWRVYRTWADSVMDYGHLFWRVAAYRPGLYHLDDSAAFLAAIVPTYAPAADGNANYLHAVLSLIETHGLRRYDVPRAEWALDPDLTGGGVPA